MAGHLARTDQADTSSYGRAPSSRRHPLAHLRAPRSDAAREPDLRDAAARLEDAGLGRISVLRARIIDKEKWATICDKHLS
eukprot:863664-Prorocentrum_lima.AAC.1